jgi:hypothetical protein
VSTRPALYCPLVGVPISETEGGVLARSADCTGQGVLRGVAVISRRRRTVGRRAGRRPLCVSVRGRVGRRRNDRQVVGACVSARRSDLAWEVGPSPPTAGTGRGQPGPFSAPASMKALLSSSVDDRFR